MTHLVAFADMHQPAGRAICDLATTSTTFRHACNLPEPVDAGRRGIYVDPIFF